MGSCQNYGPFLGTLNSRCRILLRTPKKDPNFDNHPYDSPFHDGSNDEVFAHSLNGAIIADTPLQQPQDMKPLNST